MGRTLKKKLFVVYQKFKVKCPTFYPSILQGRDDAGKSIPSPSPSPSLTLWCQLLAEPSIEPVGKAGKWFADKAK